MIIIFILFFSLKLPAQEVVKQNIENQNIHLKIIQVETDSFETYNLINENYIVMQLVCAHNRVYDNNPKAMIKLKNFYGEWAKDFWIDDNQVCLDLGKFIEIARFAVDERRPFYFTLNRQSGKVEKIIYPDVDPLALEGEIEQLYPRKRVLYPTTSDEKFNIKPN